jgi:hypothetical protein
MAMAGMMDDLTSSMLHVKKQVQSLSEACDNKDPEPTALDQKENSQVLNELHI